MNCFPCCTDQQTFGADGSVVNPEQYERNGTGSNCGEIIIIQQNDILTKRYRT